MIKHNFGWKAASDLQDLSLFIAAGSDELPDPSVVYIVDQDGHGPAELLHRGRNLRDLLGGVGSGVSGVRN